MELPEIYILYIYMSNLNKYMPPYSRSCSKLNLFLSHNFNHSDSCLTLIVPQIKVELLFYLLSFAIPRMNTIPCSKTILLCCAVSCRVVQCCGVVRCGVVWCCLVWCGAVWCVMSSCAVLCFPVSSCTVWSRPVLCQVVLYCAVPCIRATMCFYVFL